MDNCSEDWMCDYVHVWDSTIARAIKNGVVLPKGHGRLIDVHDLSMCIIARMFNIKATNNIPIEDLNDVITNETKTIIEADKENKE